MKILVDSWITVILSNKIVHGLDFNTPCHPLPLNYEDSIPALFFDSFLGILIEGQRDLEIMMLVETMFIIANIWMR